MCVCSYNEPCITRPTITDLYPSELNYHSFISSLDKCNGSCNVANDLSTKICVKVFKNDNKNKLIKKNW